MTESNPPVPPPKMFLNFCLFFFVYEMKRSLVLILHNLINGNEIVKLSADEDNLGTI